MLVERVALADIAVIVPLSEELKAARALFRLGKAWKTDTATYYPFHASSSPLRMWITCVHEMGNGPALSHTIETIACLKPKVVICVGIGGSLDSDLLIGDVAVSRSVSDIADPAKISDKPNTYQINTVNRSFDVRRSLGTYLSNIEHSEKYFAKWQSECTNKRIEIANKSPANTRRIKLLKEVVRQSPQYEYCQFASGFVIASDNFDVSVGNREFKVIETEGAGVGRACAAFEPTVPFFVIRGISDFSDSRKKEFEKVSKRDLRRLAAHNAFQLLSIIVNDPWFLAEIQKYEANSSITYAQHHFVKIPQVEFTAARSTLLKFYNGICDIKTSKEYFQFCNENAEEFFKAVPCLRFQKKIKEEMKIVVACLMFSQFFLAKKNEQGADNLETVEFILDTVDSFILSKESELEIHYPGPMMIYYHVKAYLRHRKGFFDAIVYKKKAKRVAEKAGERDQSILHQRCIYCFQSEMISEGEINAVKDVEYHLEELDNQMQEILSAHPGKDLEIQKTLFENVLVRMKAISYCGEEEIKQSDDFPVLLKQAENILTERKKASKSKQGQDRLIEYHGALLKVYRGMYMLFQPGSVEDAQKCISAGMSFINEQGVAEDCFLRLPPYVIKHIDVIAD